MPSVVGGAPGFGVRQPGQELCISSHGQFVRAHATKVYVGIPAMGIEGHPRQSLTTWAGADGCAVLAADMTGMHEIATSGNSWGPAAVQALLVVWWQQPATAEQVCWQARQAHMMGFRQGT